MCAPLAVYFADLLKDHNRLGQQILPELLDDNARLPGPCLAQRTMGTWSEVFGSCHTRSTASTNASGMSNGSTHSQRSTDSTGSNGSAGSCRWDSNPSSSTKEKTDLLRRPQRPGRKTSDSNKNRPLKTDDKPVGRPSRSNSGSNKDRPTGSTDKPKRPQRTNSSDNGSLLLLQPPTDSLDKMLLHCSSQQKDFSPTDNDSASDNSLKEIFRSASHQRRTGSSTKPLPGTGTSPPRTVNEILGQSMEELKISW